MTLGEPFILSVILRGADVNFTCTLTYLSTQVARFSLQIGQQQMELEKKLLVKSRFKWKLTQCNFEMKSDYAGENLNWLFHYLDELIKNPDLPIEYLRNKKP